MTNARKSDPDALSGHTELAAEAANAARLRALMTDPDVVALRVEKIRGQVDLLLAGAIYLGLAFTMANVQAFAAHGTPTGSTTWWAAWLLDPIPSLALLAILRAEKITARYQLTLPVWAKRTKWLAFTSTYIMNTWTSWGLGDQPLTWAGVVLHSVPPLVVLFAAEAGPGIRDTLTEAVHRASLAAHHNIDHGQRQHQPDHEDNRTRDEAQDNDDAAPQDNHGSWPAQHRATPTPASCRQFDESSHSRTDDQPDQPNDVADLTRVVDPRVHEVTHLLGIGEAHTGASIASRFGVSPRTGRRILRAAESASPSRPPPPSR